MKQELKQLLNPKLRKKRSKAPLAKMVPVNFTEDQYEQLLSLAEAETEGNISQLIRKRLFGNWGMG